MDKQGIARLWFRVNTDGVPIADTTHYIFKCTTTATGSFTETIVFMVSVGGSFILGKLTFE
jgi:hypothetical protein